LSLILYAINPGYVSQLWILEEPFIVPGVFPCGWLVIGLSLFMIALGAMAIRKIVDIEV
jgi:Flp pilus assembly protein TadB